MSSVSTTVVVTVVYSIVNFCATISPPTYKFPPIPTPPATVNAPESVDNEVVVFCVENVCATILPPTYKSPPIPTPPITCNAPESVEVADVIPYTTMLVDVTVPVDEILPVLMSVACTIKLVPVEVITALVDVSPTTNVFITNPPLGAVDKVVPPRSIVFPAR